MNQVKLWGFGLFVSLSLVMFAEGAIKSQNIPFLEPDPEKPCKSGWRHHSNHCYRIRSAPILSQGDAQRACQMESSQSGLATLTDEIRDFLSSQLEQDDIDSLWVSGTKDNCTTLTRHGAVLVSKRCEDRKGYVCAELDKFAGCPKGQIGFGHFCFSLATVKVAWRTARIFCGLQGVRGDLASIHSEEQYDFLRREFANGSDDQVWIGLHKEVADMPYRWANGDKVQYLPWTPDYMGQENQGYVAMSLQDRQFQSKKHPDLVKSFICSTVRVLDAVINIHDKIQDFTKEIDVINQDVHDAVVAVDTAAKAVFSFPIDVGKDVIDAAKDLKDEITDAVDNFGDLFKPCGKFWLPYGNLCYRAFSKKTSFHGARESCKQKGGNLASFHHPFQSEFVRTRVIKNSTNKAYWIGLSNGRKGLQWSDGSPLDYMNWNAKESNVLELSAFRGCFEISGLSVRWSSRDCDVKQFFVCQKQQAEDASLQSAKAPGVAQERQFDELADDEDTIIEEPSEIPSLKTQQLREVVNSFEELSENKVVEEAGNLNKVGKPLELKLSAEERALWEEAMEKRKQPHGAQKLEGKGAEGPRSTVFNIRNTGIIIGLFGAVLAAFGVIRWRLSAKNKHYEYKAVSKSRSRSTKQSSEEQAIESARVTDTQKLVYGTMG